MAWSLADRAVRRSAAARRPAAGRRCCARVEAVYATHRPTVLVTEKLGDAGLDRLRLTCNVETAYGMTQEQLCAKVSLVDALIVRSGTKVTRAVFEASHGRLKVVGRAGMGVDNVDLAAATEAGCLVVNAPTANTVAAAEHGIALLCAMARNIPQADACMKGGRWERGAYVGTSLTGKTIAVYGFGKVGSEVSRRARGLGLSVVAYDPYASAEKAAAQGVQLVTFDEALQVADFHTLHMPLTPGTKGLFSDSAFARMKRGARIINVARGGVIDEAALLRALESKQVAQAALDVFLDEPPTFDNHPLIHRPDVICTPHLGASTTEAQEGVALEVVEAVVDALAGNLSVNAVNAPMVPAEILRELQPYIVLAEGLGRAAVGLVSNSSSGSAAGGGGPHGGSGPHGGKGGFGDIAITYSSPRGDDLDTRLLRAMVIKGVLEETTTSKVNLVNADLLARNRGLRITEVSIRAGGDGAAEVLTSMSVALGTADSKFSGAVDRTNRIYVEGRVVGGTPFLTKIGNFDVELAVQGSVMLTRQRDQPGIVGGVGMLLSRDSVNISFMTVSRTAKDGEAIMAIGIDSEPSAATLEEITRVKGVIEVTIFKEVVPPQR
ncbi:hypothetical protein HXX76_007528 [Chlamydomonas incerta]|uniref:D-3-phosphoglycerate dehydrogenase n=1 Tax=Chlamydomonas incerta TaxID=51695 RepID=A0A835SWS2_CHLIN|nr:hypothetical protein HXX76_007528 [Chlamydomonas incerta]|eukprot:KAG2434634.1 hypothetical protein HXX76_007528 [Chlamydomonas incerta]